MTELLLPPAAPVRLPPPVRVAIPPKLQFLLDQKRRYKIARGGRGGAKSWNFARALIVHAVRGPERILCTREFQSSIKDSVHKLLSDQIVKLGLQRYFDVQRDVIRCRHNASEFLFKGLHLNLEGIKSTEGVTKCWIEEAQTVSEESLTKVIPTIREAGSEIWISYNPDGEEDPIHVRANALINDPDAIVVDVNWRDNSWFFDDSTLDLDRRRDKERDPEAYDWIWEGHTRKISDAIIFRRRVEFRPFETPDTVNRFLFGLDFGFAEDPSVLVRGYIADDVLYIDYEAYDYHVEINDLPAMMAGGKSEDGRRSWEGIPGARDWPIKADSARPETISYISRKGFQIAAAEKWPGSVEDGIEHMKGFSSIVVHDRCPRTQQEFRLYSYKTDRVTGDILPVVLDKWNHAIDAIRYSLDGYIQARGGLGVWSRLV